MLIASANSSSRCSFSEPIGDRQLLVTSHLTLAELLVKPIELGRSDLAHLYDNWTLTNSYIEAVPLVRDILSDAARLRASDKALKLADAIHLTTARGTGCSHFLTNDDRIRDRLGLAVVRLTEPDVNALLGMVERAR